MNMFARFDENPVMTLQDIKETKCYGWTHGRTDEQRENSIPTINKVCGGYNKPLSPIFPERVTLNFARKKTCKILSLIQSKNTL